MSSRTPALATGSRRTGVAALALLLAPAAASAQLRPLEPLDWTLFRRPAALSVDLGIGLHHGQRASLAGVEGRLVEIGNFRLAWRTGRVMLVASGTGQRFFHDEAVFAEPSGGAMPATGGRRHDSGDYRVATVVRLTPAGAQTLVALRFGTRLPTTDNRVGLDRDQTDFFALAGSELRYGELALGAEAGVGIHGTRDPEYEQSDVLLFALTAEYRAAALVPRFQLVGQKDGGRQPVVRGNEDLAEVRLGVRYGRAFWIEALAIRGLAEFSPGRGLLVGTGFSR